jgi:6-pyruvoyltetrahydropterin/6-carboxytetrahydropterin synthase
LHGYALGFKFVFSCEDLDARNWCCDFGGLKSLKAILEDTFDHKTVVAVDDPEIEWFREGHRRGILELVEVEAGGCEKFAELTYRVTAIVYAWSLLRSQSTNPTVQSSPRCDHGKNNLTLWWRDR